MPQGVIYGDYFLLGRLAQGGMAEVFLAKKMAGSQPNTLLALKRTLSQYAAEEAFIKMFTDEARIASGLKHPNICEIFDHGQLGDQHFIVMEFIHGKDLKVVAHRARQRNELIPHPYVAAIVARMASALHAAHSKTNAEGELEGIVHRDVSPQNILISYDGVPQLIDFGIAKAKDRLAKTQAGVVKGKFAYMSPEQAIGAEVDFRSDIFALGVVLYELLVGELPFAGASDFSTLKKIAKAEYTPPPVDRLPKRLVQTIEKSLTRSPDARYQSAQDMADDLDRYLLDEDRGVKPAALSSYMRKLFREDYIRESDRIKQYISVKPPRPIGAIEPDPKQTTRRTTSDTQDEASAVDLDSTRIMNSADLAAGYDSDESSEITGLAELLEPDEFDDVVGVIDEAGEDTGSKTLDPNEFSSDFDEPTQNMAAPPNFDFQETTAENEAPEDDELDIIEIDDEPLEIIDGESEDFDEQTIQIESLGEGDDYGTFDDAATVLATPAHVDLGKNPSTLPEAPPVDSQTKRRGTTGGGKAKPRTGQTGSQTGARAAQRRGNTGRRTGQRRRHRRPALLSSAEMVTLIIAASFGILFVFSAYYVSNFGVPPFAQGFKGAIEAVTGELPKHESEQTPVPPTTLESAKN